MGSGATKINSDESAVRIEREKSGLSICSEKNNNVTAKPQIPASSTSSIPTTISSNVRPQSGQGKQRPINVPSQSSSLQKLPDLNARKPKDIPSETKVINLKSVPLEPLGKQDEKGGDAVARLNKELATSESQRLDLLEQIQLLEEKLVSKGHQQQQSVVSNNTDSLQETLNAKDQYILKLEREAKTNLAESNKLRLKLKKRIKSLTNQLHETRQEASINQMELKAEITRQAEQLKLLKAGGSHFSSSSQEVKDTFQDQDHSKIIVELSNQLTEQGEQISSLELELSEKKKEISDLKLAISDHYDSKDSNATGNSPNPNSSLLPQTSTDRLHSSRGRRVSKPGDRSREYKTHGYTENFDTSSTPVNDEGSPFLLQRQSTALSDSDSDWGENPTPSHIHSAPARSRVKSAVSLASSGKHKGSMITLNGDDDSIMDMVNTSTGDSVLDQRESSKKRSTLRNHLEKTRVDKQTNSLIGPSLAFEKKAGAFSDTSCEPTPRPQRTLLHPDPKVRIVKPIVH